MQYGTMNSYKSQTRKLLKGTQIVSLATNLPGPAAVSELKNMGATVIKIEPPGGDLFKTYCPQWYELLIEGQEVLSLDLKSDPHRKQFFDILAKSDLLITSMRPSALVRLGLSSLSVDYPTLQHISIIGYAPPFEELAGHDLTYLARFGLVDPPSLPTTLISDLAAAQEIVSAALAMILSREKGSNEIKFVEISIAESAEKFSRPVKFGLTGSADRLLSGGNPNYNVYQTSNGWIALAALEKHFWERLLDHFSLKEEHAKDLREIFLTRTSKYWKKLALDLDIPLEIIETK